MHRRLRISIVGAALAAGCVYPAQEPTGLELSWRFLEGNPDDGDAGLRVRSCGSEDIGTIFIRVFDDDDDERTGAFRFPCDAGFQTNVSFQTDASDAFLRLDSGPYRVELFSQLEDDTLEFLSERAFEVNRRGVTVEPWLITRPTFDWEIVLGGAQTCETITLSLLYEAPTSALPELEAPEGEAPPDVLYRENLATDRGLSLGGLAQPCGAEIEGTHVVSQMDRGDYRLEIDVDGSICAIPIELDPTVNRTTLDLASLPCEQ